MQFFSWVAQNWQTVCGWAAGLYLLYRVGLVLTCIIVFFNNVATRFQKAESTLTTVATNHLPHLQTELESIGETLTNLRDDLRLALYQLLEEYDQTK